MTKKYIFWTGIKAGSDVSQKYKYGNYDWMEYSRKTWEYYSKKIGAEFIPYEKPLDDNIDLSKIKVNWIRWFDMFDIVPNNYDQILSTDASIMIKWDAPDLFDISGDNFSALLANENLRWTYQSATGYKDFFNYDFDIKKYIASGFIIFSKKYDSFWKELKNFYYKNQEDIIRHEDEIVKRGRDQPVINYLLQMNNVDVNYLPFIYGVNHMYRYELFQNNWQLSKLEPQNKEWSIPHFIKYFYVWIFSGFPDRGETRNQLMKQTWDIVKNKYIGE